MCLCWLRIFLFDFSAEGKVIKLFPSIIDFHFWYVYMLPEA